MTYQNLGRSAFDDATKLERLRNQVDEIRRIMDDLQSPVALSSSLSSTTQQARPHDSEMKVSALRTMIKRRRQREKAFPECSFADPEWDILLDLYVANLAQFRVPVSSACIAAAVPATTALRHIKFLCDSGLVKRRPDPFDARRVFLELSDDAVQRMSNLTETWLV